MSSVVRAPPGGGSPVVAQAVPVGDVAPSGGGLDAKVHLSIGKPRRRGVGRRLTLAPAPAGHDVPRVDFGFGTSVGSCGACADPLVGLRSRAYGLKFWALADELSSDERMKMGGW
jgi:hypothetical protein